MNELKSTDSNDLFNASDRTIPVSDIRALKDSLVANRIKRLTGNGPVLTIQEREAKDYLNTIRKNLREENEHTLFNDTSSYDARTYTSFSGSEATVSAVFPFGQPVVIGQCQTITYSLFRPMTPVYNLGKAKPSGYVRVHVRLLAPSSSPSSTDTFCCRLSTELSPKKAHLVWKKASCPTNCRRSICKSLS